MSVILSCRLRVRDQAGVASGSPGHQCRGRDTPPLRDCGPTHPTRHQGTITACARLPVRSNLAARTHSPTRVPSQYPLARRGESAGRATKIRGSRRSPGRSAAGAFRAPSSRALTPMAGLSGPVPPEPGLGNVGPSPERSPTMIVCLCAENHHGTETRPRPQVGCLNFKHPNRVFDHVCSPCRIRYALTRPHGSRPLSWRTHFVERARRIAHGGAHPSRSACPTTSAQHLTADGQASFYKPYGRAARWIDLASMLVGAMDSERPSALTGTGFAIGAQH